jgi:hypothetical protein
MSERDPSGTDWALKLELALLYVEGWAREAEIEAETAERIMLAIRTRAEAHVVVAAGAERRAASLLRVERDNDESLVTLGEAWEDAALRAAHKASESSHRGQRVADRVRPLRVEADRRREIAEAVAVAAAVMDAAVSGDRFVLKLTELVRQLAVSPPSENHRGAQSSIVAQLRALSAGRG